MRTICGHAICYADREQIFLRTKNKSDEIPKYNFLGNINFKWFKQRFSRRLENEVINMNNAAKQGLKYHT
jgi:hypothetical protein